MPYSPVVPPGADAGAGKEAPQLLMHQLQFCKELKLYRRGHDRVCALAQYCSRDIPGYADRLHGFDRAVNGNPSQLFDIVTGPQTTPVHLADSEQVRLESNISSQYRTRDAFFPHKFPA